MKSRTTSPYDDRFYLQQVEGSSSSAQIVLDYLFQLIAPASVLDVGCGQGAWLAAAERLGARELHGLDGPWVAHERLLSKRIHFESVDMELNIPITRRYDLAISLEVAEHLSERRAETFVAALCSASDVILFSAAIRYQGGTNHVNEQRQ